ncbi:hypothetical protein GQ44DRAFT_656388 [Phaeosphaeriaceae sp. PMI808]|nr:hypothetical protein GQ44DRAFT_656388 [Phaeosphaeriaceae sp. PMI808]
MALIGELLEDISRSPPAIAARKLLVEHYISVGWLDAAMDNAKELKTLVPRDSEVTNFLTVLQKKPDPPAPEKTKSSILSIPEVEARIWDPKTGQYKKKGASKHEKKKNPDAPTVELHGDLEPARQDLTKGYQTLRAQAKYVLDDIIRLQALQSKFGLPPSKNIAKMQAITGGRERKAEVISRPPGRSGSTARGVRKTPTEATSLIIKDLEDNMKWTRELCGYPSGANNDAVRDVLVKRANAIQSALPEELKIHSELALMHIEHEYLDRNYVNADTMLGDEVKDIPRANFYVTEDNYAWDMDELAQAIKANDGVMRNPLSKEMFTPKDVKGILIHPVGKRLAALAVEQHQLSKGVRAETILEMEKLSDILLQDQTSDTLPSRKAVDHFLAYVATLPEAEQKAIEHLKCPAKDSHTGQSYDFSIGEAVRNAKGNLVCFHKTGDFIKQAAAHLKQNSKQNPNVAPESEKCNVM